MKWMERLNENIKKTVRSWLNVLPANPFNFQINEMMDFEGHAILNRIWYRGCLLYTSYAWAPSGNVE